MNLETVCIYDLSLVLGETIIMLTGGIVYLYGVVKTGTFSANGICKGKNSMGVKEAAKKS
ncbi:hypothetical protein [Muricomes intestini]|jgi:hypothetical protein|uniref:hypothetical protein n=1 Tax=Muricomes intestini TaxID=1796634 RepID=UPI001049C77F|nr:hypothetical protein [Muricomes intestini]